VFLSVEVFLAPGMYRNIKRSIMEGVSIEEFSDVKDTVLREKVVKYYSGDTVKLWALKETLFDR